MNDGGAAGIDKSQNEIMLRTAGWLVRGIAVVVVGVGTFRHSPVTPSVLAAQATAFGVGVAALGIWALMDFGLPPMAGRARAARPCWRSSPPPAPRPSHPTARG